MVSFCFGVHEAEDLPAFFASVKRMYAVVQKYIVDVHNDVINVKKQFNLLSSLLKTCSLILHFS